MDEFSHLNEAIEAELDHQSLKNLSEKTKDLQSRYRDKNQPIISLMKSKEEKLAYVGYRMKATLGAIHSIFKLMKKELRDHKIETALDLGSGPGTSLWSFATLFPELKRLTLFERDLELIYLGKRLFSKTTIPIETEVLWTHGDFVNTKQFDEVDLVLFSYSFGEIDEKSDDSVLENCFIHAKKFIIIIEPGTPRGYKRILKARKKLIELGAYTLAPCPHDKTCPLSGNDWCHFSTRIERTALQRVLKQGSLNYEDEKFSYIIMGKKQEVHTVRRVLTEPVILKEKATLKLCTDDGLIYQDALRRDTESYKKAKKIKNGDNY